MDRVHLEPVVIVGTLAGRLGHRLRLPPHRVEHLLPQVRPLISTRYTFFAESLLPFVSGLRLNLGKRSDKVDKVVKIGSSPIKLNMCKSQNP